jgi:uncharacterized protein DUF3850
MRHELKCWPDYFARLADGSKTFEIRRNDRGYQAGDELVLYRYDPKATMHDCDDPNCYSNWRGKRIPFLTFRVGFVASGDLFGLSLGGHVVLSLLPIAPEEQT